MRRLIRVFVGCTCQKVRHKAVMPSEQKLDRYSVTPDQKTSDPGQLCLSWQLQFTKQSFRSPLTNTRVVQ